MQAATRQHLKQAAVLAFSIAAALGLSHWLGVGLPLLLAALVVVFAVTNFAPRLGVRWLDDAILAVRSWLWAKESGRHHSFAGLLLDIEEHAGLVWISAGSFQRAVRRIEPENVTSARMAGAGQGGPASWRNEEGVLMLNVQAVVNHLAQMPGRMDPRVLRLRQYLERQVLFPAGQRRSRAQAAEDHSSPLQPGAGSLSDPFADNLVGRSESVRESASEPPPKPASRPGP